MDWELIKFRNTEMSSTMKNRPHTATDVFSRERDQEYTMPGIGYATVGGEGEAPLGTLDRFQANIGSFIKGSLIS